MERKTFFFFPALPSAYRNTVTKNHTPHHEKITKKSNYLYTFSVFSGIMGEKEGYSMKLKENIDFQKFFADVAKCRKDVFFISAENDQLNLKSMLSVYIFLTASRIPNLLKNGKLLFMDPEDRLVLQDYVE
jgi:hypothetical protein